MSKRVRTILLPRRVAAIACGAIFVVAGVAGCGDEPIAKMTAAEQQRQPLKDQLDNVKSIDQPVYWLGAQYRRTEVIAAVTHRPEKVAGFDYGYEPFDFSACSGTCTGSPYEVDTVPNRRLQIKESRVGRRSCMRIIQNQIVIGCDEDETWLVLRGRQAVLISDNYNYLNESRASKMIAALKLFHGGGSEETRPTTAPLAERERQGLSARATLLLDDAFSQLR